MANQFTPLDPAKLSRPYLRLLAEAVKFDDDSGVRGVCLHGADRERGRRLMFDLGFGQRVLRKQGFYFVINDAGRAALAAQSRAK